MTLVFTDQNFENEVIKNSQPVLVDFWAPWCGPCQTMGPIIDELAKEFKGKMIVGKINVDENNATAEKYAVMSIPSLKIFKGGKVVKEFTGMQAKEALKGAVDNFLVDG